MSELMDQQYRLVQFLQHQTECPYRYFREHEGMLRIVFYHCWNKSGLVISFWVCIPVKVASVYLKSYFISSELKLASRLNIWYNLWQWSVITDSSGIYEIFKGGPCCWLGQMGHFTPILQHQELCRHAFFWNFACRVYVRISRQMKCKTYGILKSFFF